jgi:D-ribose pyranase
MLAAAGHTDEILVCDAGYPIPPGLPTVDLAYRPGQAPFLEVVEAVVATIDVEGAVVASDVSAAIGATIDRFLGFPAERIAHPLLKERARGCRGVVRTGEYTRFANVILTIGVAF